MFRTECWGTVAVLRPAVAQGFVNKPQMRTPARPRVADQVDDRAGLIDPFFAIHFDTIPALFERTANEERPIPQSRLRQLIEEARNDPDLPGPFAKGMLDPEVLHQNGICAGTPEQVARTVGRYQEAGIDQLVMLPRLASWLEDEEQVWESMRLFGKEVIPQFK